MKSSQYRINKTFARSRLIHWVRIFGLTCLFIININLLYNDYWRIIVHHMAISLNSEFIKYAMLIFLDIGYFWPMSLEVDKLELADDKFKVKTIFLTKTYSFKDIVYWKNPTKLSFGILKTQDNFIYLLNKKDLKPFDKIESYIIANLNIIKNQNLT